MSCFKRWHQRLRHTGRVLKLFQLFLHRALSVSFESLWAFVKEYLSCDKSSRVIISTPLEHDHEINQRMAISNTSAFATWRRDSRPPFLTAIAYQNEFCNSDFDRMEESNSLFKTREKSQQPPALERPGDSSCTRGV